MKRNESVLGLQEAADLLGVHFRTLRSWVKARKVPHIQYPNKKIKFRRDDLVRWMESKTIVPVEFEHPVERRQRTEKEIDYDNAVKAGNKMLAEHYRQQKQKKSPA